MDARRCCAPLILRFECFLLTFYLLEKERRIRLIGGADRGYNEQTYKIFHGLLLLHVLSVVPRLEDKEVDEDSRLPVDNCRYLGIRELSLVRLPNLSTLFPHNHIRALRFFPDKMNDDRYPYAQGT